jgi:uncharacterized protein YbjT (DUF2867 family)
MSDGRPVLVIGGTRGTGLIIARLLDRKSVAVRVLARNPRRAAAMLGPAIEVVAGDITKESSLPPALKGARDIVFTAGCRSGRPVSEARVRAVEYAGVLNTLATASRGGFAGRFLYMTASGVGTRSFWTLALNLYKGRTLVWRRRSEDAIRASGLAYTIIRAAMLTNDPGATRAIEVTQRELPLSPRYRIARADVAEVFVATLDHPRTVRATFEVVWGLGPWRERWAEQLEHVMPDEESPNG